MYECIYVFVVPPDMMGLLTFLTNAHLGKDVEIHLWNKGIHKVNSVMPNDGMIMRMRELNAPMAAELWNSHGSAMTPTLNWIIQLVYTPALEHWTTDEVQKLRSPKWIC